MSPFGLIAVPSMVPYPTVPVILNEHHTDRSPVSQGKSVRPSTSSNLRPTNLRLSNQYFVGHTCAPAIPIWRACAPGSWISRDREGTTQNLTLSFEIPRFRSIACPLEIIQLQR
jgi:hypothetical protein